MTTVDDPSPADSSVADPGAVVSAVHSFLDENWDPDLTVAEWWDRLGRSGWGAPSWPEEWYGKGLSRSDSAAAQRAIRAYGALPAPGGLGLLLAGPTIIIHGTDEQKERFLLDIVTGAKGWCQLFSEPGAGSDLAGLQTRAERDGDEFIVNGQKVWTSGGHVADLGMLIARTDADLPKHQGISYFGIDMHQPGIDVRPLREMTGRALFNEVFISDARVHIDDCIGDLGQGWAVANTTLMAERAGLGAAAGGEAVSRATPGTVGGDLDRRAGDFVGDGPRAQFGDADPISGPSQEVLLTVARRNGKISDPTIRQKLMRLHTLSEVDRFNGLRLKAANAVGQDIPGLPNMSKLQMSEMMRQARDCGAEILGPAAMLHGYDGDGKRGVTQATDNPDASAITEMMLWSPGPSIYGGTDQIQRNIIGERVLGLPKEPNKDKETAFKDLPKNS